MNRSELSPIQIDFFDNDQCPSLDNNSGDTIPAYCLGRLVPIIAEKPEIGKRCLNCGEDIHNDIIGISNYSGVSGSSEYSNQQKNANGVQPRTDEEAIRIMNERPVFSPKEKNDMSLSEIMEALKNMPFDQQELATRLWPRLEDAAKKEILMQEKNRNDKSMKTDKNIHYNPKLDIEDIF